MASTALEGTLREASKVRVGFVRIFVGDVGTTYDKTAKFDTVTPPTGWRDLGATGDDTEVNATKEIFSLKTGLLRTIKFQAVTGLEGKLTAKLIEYDAVGIYQALGAALPFNVLRASPTACPVLSAASKSVFTLGGGHGSDLAVADRIAVDTAALLTRTLNTSVITTIATDTITVDPPLFVQPTALMFAQKAQSRKLAAGSTQLPRFAMLAVHDFANDAGQVCYHFPNCDFASAGFKPDFAGGKENVKVALEATAYGVTDADINDTVVFTIHDFD